MALWEFIVISVIFVLELFKAWLYYFAAPFTDYYVIWIIIPIWINWFFGEFFQEKRGTSFGNAISNGAIPIFVSVDWARSLTTNIIENNAPLGSLTIVKYLICIIAFIYGISVVIYGIKGRHFVHFLGRLRTMSYILAMFTPVIYGLIDLDLRFIAIILLFFPLFYFVIELVDIIIPDPKIFEIDRGPGASMPSSGSLGPEYPEQEFPPKVFHPEEFSMPGKRPKF